MRPSWPVTPDMRYHTRNDHVFELTEAETDVFFEEFDPSDYEMPSHLFRAGHRYIKEDIYEWMVANIGQPQVDWKHDGNSRIRQFQILDAKKAMLFKLT